MPNPDEIQPPTPTQRGMMDNLAKRVSDQHGRTTMMQVGAELPRYQSHKKVWALKIKEVKRVPSGNATVTHTIVPLDERYAPFEVSLEYIGKHSPQAGGYYVVYDDGYKSFSPASAFEEGYTLIPR